MIAGFVMIVAYFIPYTEDWGEVVGIWFDVLAAIAFILGGGNLLKIHVIGERDRGARSQKTARSSPEVGGF